jgi:hypothetical protein
MAGGDPSGAQSPHIVQTDAELDFPITQNIGIRRAPGRIFAQEMCKYALAIFGRKADPMQRDPELVADFAGVLEILGGRAVGIVVVFPVGHEQSLHRVACLEQQ